MRAHELSRIGIALGLWGVLSCAPRAESTAPTTTAQAEPAPAPAPEPTVEPPPAAPPPAQPSEKKHASVSKPRLIHPQPGSQDCVEMYGTCSPPPDPICTSSAFVLSCGETGQPPGSKQPIQCVCP